MTWSELKLSYNYLMLTEAQKSKARSSAKLNVTPLEKTQARKALSPFKLKYQMFAKKNLSATIV